MSRNQQKVNQKFHETHMRSFSNSLKSTVGQWIIYFGDNFFFFPDYSNANYEVPQIAK